jgi:hypothetical protein
LLLLLAGCTSSGLALHGILSEFFCELTVVN